MLSKKGEEVAFSNIAGTTLALASFLVVMGVVLSFFGGMELIENSICKATVYFSDQTGGEGDFIPYLDVNPILCRTHYKELENMEDLAGVMIDTWDIWGEGELDPSGTNWLKWGENKCFQQYRVEVTEELNGITKSQFERFLKDEGDVSGKSYWNFINKGDIDRNRVILNFDVLNEGDFIAVIYFEQLEPTRLNPLWWGYYLDQFFNGDYTDFILITKDDPKNPIGCVEIT